METLTVRQVAWKTLLINLIAVVVPLSVIVPCAYAIQHTSAQTAFLIATLSVVGGVNYLIVRHGTYLIDIELSPGAIAIRHGERTLFASPFSAIRSYNAYPFINRRGGHVLRLDSATGRYCGLLTWRDFNAPDEKDKVSFTGLYSVLDQHVGGRKRSTGVDLLLKLFSAAPYIAVAVALLMLVGMFVYVIQR